MKLKGTGREYQNVGWQWVFIYTMYMIGVISVTMFFVIGWVFYL